MLFLRSGKLYWDGTEFQSDYRKAVVFGSMSVAGKDILRAIKIDPNCRLEVMTSSQWDETTFILR
jgi:hypothetical protein